MICIFMGPVMPAEAEEIYFTQVEKDYINRATVLKVVSINGVAPLSYLDSRGTVKGIGISILYTIFKIYNNQNIIIHRKLTDKIKEAINWALRNAGEDIILYMQPG